MTKTRTYHYTTGNKLSPISTSGCLLPTNVLVAPHEKPVLWFSLNPVYEPTAIKLIVKSYGQAYRPSVQELHQLIGIFRFGIDAGDARLATFNKLPRLARISPIDVSRMVASGLRIGATPTHWSGSLVPIALAELEFEEWTGDTWVSGNLHEAIARIQNNGLKVQSVKAAAAGITNAY